MNELKIAMLALEGVINKIQNLFIIREVNDSKISELKTYIEYYDQIKNQIEILKKEKSVSDDAELSALFKKSIE